MKLSDYQIAEFQISYTKIQKFFDKNLKNFLSD